MPICRSLSPRRLSFLTRTNSIIFIDFTTRLLFGSTKQQTRRREKSWNSSQLQPSSCVCSTAHTHISGENFHAQFSLCTHWCFRFSCFSSSSLLACLVFFYIISLRDFTESFYVLLPLLPLTSQNDDLIVYFLTCFFGLFGFLLFFSGFAQFRK